MRAGEFSGYEVKLLKPTITVVDFAREVAKALPKASADNSLFVRGISCIMAPVFVGGMVNEKRNERPEDGSFLHANLMWIMLPTDGRGMSAAVMHVFEPHRASTSRRKLNHLSDRIFQAVSVTNQK